VREGGAEPTAGGQDETDDCPHCGADLARERLFVAGLLMLCNACLTEVPPPPASAWGPPVRRLWLSDTAPPAPVMHPPRGAIPRPTSARSTGR
jgi:hypothetical protein